MHSFLWLSSIPLYICTTASISSDVSMSVGFSRQEYWSGLPFPSPGDLPNPGLESASPALAGRFFTTEPVGKPERRLKVDKWKIPWANSSVINEYPGTHPRMNAGVSWELNFHGVSNGGKVQENILPCEWKRTSKSNALRFCQLISVWPG